MEDRSYANEKLPEFLQSFTECKICYGTLRLSMECLNCNNLYCKECITQWTVNNNKCPFCRKSIVDKLRENIPIQRIADQTPMTCPFKSKGCKLCPAFKDYESHTLNCEYKNRIEMEMEIETKIPFKDIYNKIKDGTIYGENIKKVVDSLVPNNAEEEILYYFIQNYVQLGKNVQLASHNYKQLLGKIRQDYGENNEHYMECLDILAKVEKKLGNYEIAMGYITKIIKIIRDSSADSRKDINSYLVQLADIKRKNCDLEGAEVDYISCIPYIKDNKEFMNVYRGLGIIHKKKFNYDKALECYVKVLDKNLYGGEFGRGDLAIIYIDVGDIYRKKEMHKDAIGYYELAYKNLLEAGLDMNLDAVDLYNSWAQSLINMNEIQRCEGLVDKAINILKDYKNHYKSGLTLSIVGDLCAMKGQYDEALDKYKEAIGVTIASLGEDHIEVADVRMKYIEAVIKRQTETRVKSNLSGILEELDIVQKIYEKVFDSQHYKIEKCQTYKYLINEGIVA
ncbi:Tetratricopeptide repeat protein [Orpheovirus IHUMI-LCC2]|uniref:Tetratricopeptide repeat protein n=1 Tax=Orpheovirus IHUMI-LCC2 TaxID=2023057 RepID=A0A2I2L4V8_9VIRU|nr:Tetratricopeptide repeat protein [Orpheovirus IHUMI-LCC2]SNW62564.1 Tetratricopeptide repeat protein [Orpheovirus IHUMI-LCC2]